MKSRPVARALQILELKKRPFYESMSIALSALHHNWGEIIFEVAFLLSFTCWDANSLVIFIPRGFGESGDGNMSFLGDRGNENLFPGLRVGVRGNFGEYFVSDLKLI